MKILQILLHGKIQSVPDNCENSKNNPSKLLKKSAKLKIKENPFKKRVTPTNIIFSIPR